MQERETLANGDLLEVGGIYRVKMRGTGKIVSARFNGRMHWNPKHFAFTSLETDRDIYTRSKQVILRRAFPCPSCGGGPLRSRCEVCHMTGELRNA